MYQMINVISENWKLYDIQESGSDARTMEWNMLKVCKQKVQYISANVADADEKKKHKERERHNNNYAVDVNKLSSVELSMPYYGYIFMRD